MRTNWSSPQYFKNVPALALFVAYQLIRGRMDAKNRRDGAAQWAKDSEQWRGYLTARNGKMQASLLRVSESQERNPTNLHGQTEILARIRERAGGLDPPRSLLSLLHFPCGLSVASLIPL